MVDTEIIGDVMQEIGEDDSEEITATDEHSSEPKRRRFQRKDPAVGYVRSSRKTAVGNHTSLNKKKVLKSPLHEMIRKEGERVGERTSNRREHDRARIDDSRSRRPHYDERQTERRQRTSRSHDGGNRFDIIE